MKRRSLCGSRAYGSMVLIRSILGHDSALMVLSTASLVDEKDRRCASRLSSFLLKFARGELR